MGSCKFIFFSILIANFCLTQSSLNHLTISSTAVNASGENVVLNGTAGQVIVGKSYSVRDFVKKCFDYVDLDYKKFVKINKKLMRPSKTSVLVANTNKAKKYINYNQNKTNLNKLIKIMMDSQLKKYNE